MPADDQIDPNPIDKFGQFSHVISFLLLKIINMHQHSMIRALSQSQPVLYNITTDLSAVNSHLLWVEDSSVLQNGCKGLDELGLGYWFHSFVDDVMDTITCTFPYQRHRHKLQQHLQNDVVSYLNTFSNMCTDI